MSDALRETSSHLQSQIDNLDRHIEHAETDLKRMKEAREKLVSDKAANDGQLPQPKPEKAPKA